MCTERCKERCSSRESCRGRFRERKWRGGTEKGAIRVQRWTERVSGRGLIGGALRDAER